VCVLSVGCVRVCFLLSLFVRVCNCGWFLILVFFHSSNDEFCPEANSRVGFGWETGHNTCFEWEERRKHTFSFRTRKKAHTQHIQTHRCFLFAFSSSLNSHTNFAILNFRKKVHQNSNSVLPLSLSQPR